MKKKIINIIFIIISITIISIAAVGCGSKKGTASIVSKPEMPATEAKDGLSNDNTTSDSVKTDSKELENSLKKDTSVDLFKGQGKIIRNGTIQMETLSFDDTVKKILRSASSMGGYVQSSNVSGRSLIDNSYIESRKGEFVLRIPKSKFDSFILDIGNLGSIINQRISTEDITSAYFDTQAHLKALTIQEERLLELLKKTGQLKDIIVLEKELSSVRFEIESLTGNLNKWDNLVDFSTLNIQLSEVHKIKENPVSFGDKIVNGFTDSVKSLIDFGKDIVVVISIFIPYLVILSIVLLIIRYIYVHRKRDGE